MIETFLEWFLVLGYTGIVIMMLLESTFFPIPSEIIMIPAGVLAARGDMDPWAAIACGVIGSCLGALVNYYLAVWLGRPFLLAYGKFVLIPPPRLEKVEGFFRRHGEISTFVGRLIPGVRHWISFPAGLAGMNMGRFLLFTGVGSSIWSAILLAIGYWAGKEMKSFSLAEIQLLWSRYAAEITWGLVLFCLVVVGLYMLWYRRRKMAER